MQLSMKADFTRLERSLLALAGRQVKFAAARALNDCARAARDSVNRDMPQIFDRPTRFTERAVVAPRELAATPASLTATVTVRPIQAQYLRHEEEGGTRTPAENTRRQGVALVMPGPTLPLDAFGNIPNRTLAKLDQQAKANKRLRKRRRRAILAAKRRKEAVPTSPLNDDGTVVFLERGDPGNKAAIGGYFRRLTGHGLARLTVFEPSATYRPRLGYHQRVEATAQATWPGAMMKRLLAAIATAR
jgi:hypothetical protein